MNRTKTNREIRSVCKSEIFWRQLERRLLKLQKRIYRAFMLGNIKVGRRLQKTLISSSSAKCLALKQAIEQDDSNLRSPAIIINLAQELKLNSHKRVKIAPMAKLDKLKHKALQVLALMSLEPEWQAQQQDLQQSNSRFPVKIERSKHAAVKAVVNAIRDRPKFVLQIKFNLNNLDFGEEKLLKAIDVFPRLNRQIKTCLNRRIVQNNHIFQEYQSRKNGFELFLIIADLVINQILKQGLNNWLNLPQKQLQIIKYQHEFVVISDDQKIVKHFALIWSQCLLENKLNLSACQMSFANTIDCYERQQPGFDFLGFHLRQVRGRKNNRSNIQTVVTPSKEAVQQHDREIAKAIDRLKSTPVEVLIKRLNSKLEQWVNYYSLLVKPKFFHQRDHILWLKLWSWAKYRHPRKSARFIWEKYRKKIGNNWIFIANCQSGHTIHLHSYAKLFINKSMHLKHYVFEEPCERKLSSTVLQPS